MMNKSEVVSLTTLVIFAVLQVNLLLGRANPANHEVDALTSGNRVPPIVGLDETSTPVRIDWADTSITILFAFHSKCPFCDDVAPAWREWLETFRGGRIVLISNDLPRDALEYRRAHSWPGTIITLTPRSSTDLASRLTGKTPWIYIVDQAGQLLYEGHGANLGAVTDVLNSVSNP